MEGRIIVCDDQLLLLPAWSSSIKVVMKAIVDTVPFLGGHIVLFTYMIVCYAVFHDVFAGMKCCIASWTDLCHNLINFPFGNSERLDDTHFHDQY